MKLALIQNPKSGYNRRRPGRVAAAAVAAGIPCLEASNPEELRPVMQSLAELRPDALIVNGGDGTVDAVVTCLRREVRFKREPALVVLPGGSTNMIARDVGFELRPDRAIALMARAVRGELAIEALSRSPFSVGTGRGAETRLGFFLAGGAMPPVLRRAQKAAHARGFVGLGGEVATLLRATTRLIAGNLRKDPDMHPRNAGWTIQPAREGGAESGELVLYFVTTLDRLVLGARPGQTEPNLRFLALRYPYRNVLASIVRVLCGRPFDRLDRNMVFRAGRCLELTGGGDVVVDGEFLPSGDERRTLRIEMEPPLTFWRTVT